MIWQKRDNKIRKGFTLVELLVVIVILSLLAGITAPKLFKQIDESKWKLTKTKMKDIETSIDAYLFNCGEYPNSLNNLLTNPGIDGWLGPYLKQSQLQDPWGFEYIYVPNGTINSGSYDIISYGKDGTLGGDGYNADQYND
ncbi:MAG: type II secretion system major pseudopilin GspG [Sedimentisphaerales bacterium]|nr:type II secretion system major pseudopilin GspG [Sedimentisphaerales bacterium]